MRRSSAALLLAAVFLSSCEQGPRRFDVSGKITFQGTPVPAGMIYFDPDVARGQVGPQGYAPIKDGAYNTANPGGKGTSGGPTIVRIQGYDGKSGNDLPQGQPLFSEFRKEVDLPPHSTTLDFDVQP
jgi:hypothetical protein